MIFSAEQLLSDNQAITGDAPSDFYIDLGMPGTPHRANQLERDVGPGEPVCLETMVTEDFNNLTSLTIELQVDNDEAFGSPTTVTAHTFPVADLVVGGNIPNMYLPEGIDERYFRLNYEVTGVNPTTGTIYAGISGGRQTNQ